MKEKKGNKTPVVQGLPKLDYREIILKDLEQDTAKADVPAFEKQGIFLFNLEEYKNKIPALKEMIADYFNKVDVRNILPSDDFFIVDPHLKLPYIFRILKTPEVLKTVVYQYNRLTQVANIVYVTDTPHVDLKELKKSSPLARNIYAGTLDQIPGASELILSFLYSVSRPEVVIVERTKPEPNPDRVVIERTINLTKPRKRYADPKNPKPEDSTIGYEFERRV